MGSSDAAEGGLGVDCSVGTIVWVRRRNGSWWPGRILGQHELSASHLMSPRSGTPVKLLGREDASVDWYNLEKSKRVKAFRCGEFNACIERAEASQGVPIKKREKYARREDAILHALELEKQQLEKKQQKLGTNSNNMSCKHSDALIKELNSHSSFELDLMDDECMNHDEFVNLKLQSHSRITSEEVNGSSSLHPQNNRSDKQMIWEDDNSDAMPRMRALQDFGLHIAPSKKKAPCSLVCEKAKHSLVDNHADISPDSGNGMGIANGVGSGNSSSAVKRKRSHGGLVEESPVKRRDRRRPLVQVLKSSAKLLPKESLQDNCVSASILAQEEKEYLGTICRAKRSRCIYLPADSNDRSDHSGYFSDQMQLSPIQFVDSNGLRQLGSLQGEDTSSGLIRGDGTSSSERECVDADVEEEATGLQDVKLLASGSRNSVRHVSDVVSTLEDQESLGKISNDYDTSLSDCNTHILSNDETAGPADVGVSKWHMKGKRNIRNLTKRSMEVLDGKSLAKRSDDFNSSLNGIIYAKKQSIFKTGREKISGISFYQKDEELNYSFGDGFFEKDLDNPMVGFGNHRFPLMLKPASRDNAIGAVDYSDDDSREMFSSGWEADEPLHFDRRTYWGESDECLDPLFVRPLNVEKKPPLFDVDLKVQASYQGEHVPLVSLMSRLNGKAIIGHPVVIEILQDGSTDLLLPRNGLGIDTIGVDYTAPPPVWRTGRRTAMQRVPRADLAPSALEGEEPELDPCSSGKPPFKELHAAFPHQASSLKKSSHHRLPMGKFHKKLLKKGSLASQKTRTLSSIVTEHKRTGKNAIAKHGRKDVKILGGIIKPGGTVPLVACVPVKVVFSRILEVVGRPSCASSTHWSLLTGLAERKPS